ncbi:MAG: hypothetical protein ACI942_002209, partial [Planctomycetota bacterium]
GSFVIREISCFNQPLSISNSYLLISSSAKIP